MTVPGDLTALSRDDLLRVITKQQGQLAELAARVEALQAEGERRKREGQRQAAPFSKGTRGATPKKPGRKPGQGSFAHRAAPAPEALTEPAVEVPMLLTTCPVCGGRLAAEGTELASSTDLPEEVRPRGRQFRVGMGRCTACGHRVRGRHPDLALDQWGAPRPPGGSAGHGAGARAALGDRRAAAQGARALAATAGDKEHAKCSYPGRTATG